MHAHVLVAIRLSHMTHALTDLKLWPSSYMRMGAHISMCKRTHTGRTTYTYIYIYTCVFSQYINICVCLRHAYIAYLALSLSFHMCIYIYMYMYMPTDDALQYPTHMSPALENNTSMHEQSQTTSRPAGIYSSASLQHANWENLVMCGQSGVAEVMQGRCFRGLGGMPHAARVPTDGDTTRSWFLQIQSKPFNI